MAKSTVKQALHERLSQSFRRIPPEDVPRIFRLRLAEIEPNPDQPRKQIEQNALRELAASIERHGLIQPITVKRSDIGADRYTLVAGERRFRAHELLGREEILAIVTQGAADEIALIENIQRQNLHPLDEAAAYARMMEAHGWTQEELADAVGKARPTVTNILKLNGLSDTIKSECIQREDVSKSVLFEIARQNDVGAQERLWAQVRDGATVRGLRTASSGRHSPHSRSSRHVNMLHAVAASGRRFLLQLQAAEDGAGEIDQALRQEITDMRTHLEKLLRQMKGLGGRGKP